MKRFLAVILSFGLLYVLLGCTEEVQTPDQTLPLFTTPDIQSPTEVTTNITEPIVQYQLPLFSAATAPIQENFTSPDGALLLTYTYQDLILTLEDPQIADSVAFHFLNLADPSGPDVSKILEEAQQAYGNADNWSPYRFQRLFTPTRLDRGILSMYGTQTLSSDISGNTAAGISLTYDLITGQQLAFHQILRADYSADELAQKIVHVLSPLAEEGILYSDYAYVVAEMFSSNTPIENWYLSQQGLCIYFAPYEVAPYSAGTIIATVPYAELNGILLDAYYPEETITLTGALSMELFAAADIRDFTQFAELIMDRQGTEYLLHAEGAVSNLQIEIGTWEKDGNFLAESTIFTAATLCNRDAVILQLNDTMLNNIRITYRSGEHTYCIPLTSILTFH